jgi:PhnB protein
VSDGEAAILFYEKAFGAKLEAKMPGQDGKRLMHVHLTINGGSVFLVDDFPEFDAGEGNGMAPPTRLGGSGVTIHLEVTDADAFWKRAVDAGVTIVMPLDNMFWGARYGKVKDPFGHIWSFGGPVK